MQAFEIAAVAYTAGITNAVALQNAVAIALAESGGNVRAYNGRGRDQSYGLWQINMKPSEVGDRKKELGISRNEDLFDPLTNAKAMVKISGGGRNWKPWTTWPVRAALFMPTASNATARFLAGKEVGENVVEGGKEVADAITPDGIQDIAEGVRATTRWVSDRDNWLRVAKVAVGGILVVGGIVIIARPIVGSAVGSTVGTVVKKAVK